MRCELGRRVPGVFDGAELRGICKSLLCHQRLKRCQPVQVIRLARIRLTCFGNSCNAFRQCLSPFLLGEQTFFVQQQGHCERLRLPRLAEDRAIIVILQKAREDS